LASVAGVFIGLALAAGSFYNLVVFWQNLQACNITYSFAPYCSLMLTLSVLFGLVGLIILVVSAWSVLRRPGAFYVPSV
jgi:hypothetical protein